MNVAAPVAGGLLRLAIAEFPELRDVRPRGRELVWDDLADRLTKHVERRQKDGPGWSPTLYRDRATRAKRGVVCVTALALDFDHTEPPWTLLDRLAYAAHTTFRHMDGDPRWRVVVPLTRPIPADEWPSWWARAQRYFGATADEQCKDCSRFFYLPSCPPGAPRAVRRNDGVFLDPDTLPRLPEKTRPPKRSAAPRGSVSPYAQKALDDECAAVAATAQGGRNSRLNSAAYSLGQLVSAGQLDHDLVQQRLEHAAHRCGLVDDDGLASVQRTIRSGLEAGEQEPRAIPASEPLKLRPEDLPARTNGVVHAAESGPPPSTIAPDEDGLTPEPSSYHLTDLGNAQRLVAAHGEDLRYCFQVNHWFIWDGSRWAEDITAEIERRAKATVRSMYRQASYPDVDDGERKALVKHALKSEAHRSITAMVALARSEPGVPVTTDQLDRDAWLLAAKNGTLDLRTGELWPHRRSDLITKIVPLDYDPSATCPTWDAFLERIMAGSHALIEFLQRAVGYSLTGSTRDRATFFLYGTGANGKSTLLETLSALLGDYAETTRAETLLVKTYDGGIPNDVAALKGARFVSTSETEEGKRLAEALVKAITGGDTLSARFMRGEFFKFKPSFKLWLASNHRPVIRGTDHAIWDRIRLVPFEVRIPEDEQDKDLAHKLHAELAGILTWAVRGCLEWQRAGLGMPHEVAAAIESYRDEMDVLAAFIADCCVVADGARSTAKELYSAYRTWCEDGGEKAASQKAFSLRLQEKGFRPGRTMTGRYHGGIGLAGHEQQVSMHDGSHSMTDHDGFSDITGLSAPHDGLPRTTRHDPSWNTNPSCRACGKILDAAAEAAGFGLHLNCVEP